MRLPWVIRLQVASARVKMITMKFMFQHSFLRVSVFVAGLSLAASLFATDAFAHQRRGRKYKAPPATSRIVITVLRFADCKPVKNAAVVFHVMSGEKDKGYMELKTNEDGKAVITVLPIGDVMRLQVISRDYQTYGQDYPVTKPEMALQIELKRPGQQYSIYENHGQGEKDGGRCNVDQAEQPSKDTTQGDSKPQSGGANQSDTKADSNAPSSPQK